MEGGPCVALLDHNQDSASAQQEAVTTHPTLRTRCRPRAEQVGSSQGRAGPRAGPGRQPGCAYILDPTLCIFLCVCARASFSTLPTPNSKFLRRGLDLSRRSKTQRESRC